MKSNFVIMGTVIGYVGLVIAMNMVSKTNLASKIYTELDADLIRYIEGTNTMPIEPRKDDIYHFIPGLDGMVVDYTQSYNAMMINGGFDSDLIVCESVPSQTDPSLFKQEPIYKGNEAGPYVSLLINVAWGEEEVEQMLTTLDELEIKANFFFEGRYAMNHMDQVLRVHTSDHVVGNHSYSHPSDWGQYTYDGYKDELVKTNEILSNIINEPITYFAPPGGEFKDSTLEAAADLEMYTILWTVDTIDWRGDTKDVILERVLSKVTPGSLILMHPKEATVEALETLIVSLKDKGYGFKTIDEMVQGSRPECIVPDETK